MKKKITQIPIDNIKVNPENPRFEPVITITETFVMQQLLNNRKDKRFRKAWNYCKIYGWHL